MSDSLKKIIGIAVAVVVIAAGAGYFVYLPKLEKDYEEQVSKFIEAIPGDLKAESVKANAIKKEVTITNLKGTTKYYDGSDVQLSAAKVTVTGINLTAGMGKGAEVLADALSIEDVAVHLEPAIVGEPMPQDISIKSLTSKKVRGDLAAAIALQQGAHTNKEFIGVLSSFILEDVRLANYATNATTQAGSQSFAVSSSIESAFAKKSSLLSVEDGEWKNMQVSMMGKNIMSMERLSIKSVTMPDLFSPVMDAADKGEVNDESILNAFSAALQEKPLSIKGMEIDEMQLQPMLPESISISKLTMDIVLDQKELQFKETISELNIPASLYALTGFEGMAFAQQYGNKPLNINFATDVTFTAEGNKGVLNVNNFSLGDTALAEVSGQSRIILDATGNTLSEIMSSVSDVAFGKSQVMIEEKNLINTFLAAENTPVLEEAPADGQSVEAPAKPSAAQTRKKYADALRASMAMEENAGGEPINPELKLIREGLYQLLEQPGKLVISINPELPILLSRNPSQMNATVDFDPANK